LQALATKAASPQPRIYAEEAAFHLVNELQRQCAVCWS